VLKENRGTGEAMLFARSATVGGQQFPVHWGGDCSANYDSMAESLRGGLSLCLSGFGFWSHDISGFERTAPPDVYKRWTAFGLLSTHSRLHGNESYRVPWLFDEESVDVLRFFTKLKCSLMPYIFSAACEAANEGVPVMRAMVLEFPGDPACDFLDRQYMLGGSLLVAPIFNSEGRAAYYLPEGSWTNLITGETIQGGRWRDEPHGYLSIPLLVRPNSMIAVGNNDGKPDYDFAHDVALHVFELAPGKAASAVVYGMDGKPGLEACAKREGDIVEFVAKGDKPYKLVLRGIKEIRRADGAAWEIIASGAVITPGPGVKRLEIHVG
jgi:alpha-D-xyloside xylohydrolase